MAVENTPMETLKYAIYARKSLESEDRQVQSIEDQLTRLREIAELRSLNVVATLTEAKSAKTPDARPVFAQLISRIEKGELDGILCWQINRLSRNPIDSGRLNWLLQRGVLKSIQTVEREYRPEDNVLLLAVEAGMANQFILDLVRNVKRGIQGKLDRGELPGRAPVGYLNDVATRTVVRDPDRFLLIQQAWGLMLSGNYSIKAVLRKLNGEWRFKSMVRPRTGGRPLVLSTLYHLFTNSFYAGVITVKGKEYPGKHEPMITLDEFDAVQRILGRRDRLRPSRNLFTYSGLLRCGECGCRVTAERRLKRLVSNGQTACYTYYHCTLRRIDYRCSQRRYVSEEQLTGQIAELLAPLSILPVFRDHAIRMLSTRLQQLESTLDSEVRIVEAQIADRQQQLSHAVDLCVRGIITESELASRRAEAQQELDHLSIRHKVGGQGKLHAERLERVFKDITGIVNRFLRGTMEDRRNMMSLVGSNWVLKDGKVAIQAREWCVPIVQEYKALEAEVLAFEPVGKPTFAEQTGVLALPFSRWWAVVEEVGKLLKRVDNENYKPPAFRTISGRVVPRTRNFPGETSLGSA